MIHILISFAEFERRMYWKIQSIEDHVIDVLKILIIIANGSITELDRKTIGISLYCYEFN